MTRTNLIKAALVCLFVAAGVAAPFNQWHPSSWFDWGALVAMVVFGIVNVIFSLPGTQWVRAIAIGLTLAALIWPRLLFGPTILFIWLGWPLALLVAWATARGEDSTLDAERPRETPGATRARVGVAAMVVAVAIASVVYRILVTHRLEQTAALFVGIPALLAILVVFWVSPRSATGVICKAVTIGLLVSMIFLGEGILCVVMSAPLFYAIAVLVGASVTLARRRLAEGAGSTLSCVAVLALLSMSLEGVTGATSFNRDEWATETKIVHASSQAVARAMFEPPRFDRALPLYLRAGFPRPISTRLERGAAGTRLVIRLRGGEMRLNGIEPRMGDLTLDLEEMRPGFVQWRAVGDDSHMTHFLLWREARVQWEPISAYTTRVTWTLRYRRSLDPAWYFGPWERYATRLAAGYLIDSVATP